MKAEWKIFKDKAVWNTDVMFRYWLTGLAIMMVSNMIISSLLNAGQAENEQAVQSMINALPWAMLIDAGILAPFIEEIVFRKSFKDIFQNKWAFAIASALVFGGMHVVNASSAVGYLFIIPYGCLGFVFALMYNKTNTVYTSVFAHMLHNSILTLISIL